ncbi:MAG: TMEM175 family protein [Chloroflexota bacterium]
MTENELETETKETQRLEAFSDGVFAIAITLLVLEIRLPSAANGEAEGGLLAQLTSLWPTYLAYIISFVTIGIMWTNHDALLKDIKRADRPFVLINILLLMVITFLNFPTVVMADFLQKPDANIAAVFYSGTLFVIAVLYNGIWWYASSREGLFSAKVDRAFMQKVSRQYMYGPLYYLAAVVIALFSPVLSLLICLGLAVYFALTGRRE